MDFARIGAKLREQIFQFLGELSLGLPPLRHGNDLWDSGPSVGTADGGGAVVGRKDPGQEDGGKVIAAGCPTLFFEYVTKEEEEKERPLGLEIGYHKVRLPGRPELLTLVVVRGFGQTFRLNGAGSRSGMWWRRI
jgi:hypothetical protein